MKKISIIIPFKNEREGQLGIALSSINSQFDVDFSQIDVHLVNDGGAAIDLQKFAVFENLDLHYYEIENVGAGMARQYGIDHSTGDYIMFIDADDMLYYGAALYEFLKVIENGDHQVLIARFMEQYPGSDGRFWYTTHPQANWSAVYAKCFNRQYLTEMNLSFRPELRIFEDTYFVGLACQLATDIHYMPNVVYAWLSNPDSLTRGNDHSFEHQLHTLALENRLYLQVIRDKQPENLLRDFENYIATIYMRYQVYPPADEPAFWEEQHKLMAEFKDIWVGYDIALQEKVNHLRDEKNGKWSGVSTDAFEEFVKKSEAELKA